MSKQINLVLLELDFLLHEHALALVLLLSLLLLLFQPFLSLFLFLLHRQPPLVLIDLAIQPLSFVVVLLAVFYFMNFFVEFELVGFLEALCDAEAHEVVADFDGDGPLGVVDVYEVAVLLGDFFCLLQHFLVVELGVVATLEVQHPTPHLLVLRMLQN